MTKVLLTSQAQTDLADIWLFIARDHVQAADRWISELDQACEKLAEMPGIGRARDELAPGLRGYAVGAYVIFYRRLNASVQIIRVLNAARDIDNLF